MSYLGDFKVNAVVNCFFTTNAAAGGAVAPSTAFEAAGATDRATVRDYLNTRWAAF